MEAKTLQRIQVQKLKKQNLLSDLRQKCQQRTGSMTSSAKVFNTTSLLLQLFSYNRKNHKFKQKRLFKKTNFCKIVNFRTAHIFHKKVHFCEEKSQISQKLHTFKKLQKLRLSF